MCRQLGYSDAVRMLNIREVLDARSGAIWYKKIKCNGTESRIQDCIWISSKDSSNRRDDAGLICKMSMWKFIINKTLFIKINIINNLIIELTILCLFSKIDDISKYSIIFLCILVFFLN